MKPTRFGMPSLCTAVLPSRSTFSRLTSALLLALLLTTAGILQNGTAYAQLAGTGAISGTVTDSTGAVVPNATITAKSNSTNVEIKRTSTGAGDYNITPLLPGVYTVIVEASGFQKLVQENVSIDALATVSLPIKLTVGQASETVTVTEAPPLLSTTDATLGGAMDNEMYSNLPLQMGQNGLPDQRRATDFAYLMPGVQSNFTSNNTSNNTGSVNGSGPSGGVSEIYIDGINLPEADQVGDPRFTWTALGVDAIDQFQVQTAGISAQYGGQGLQNYTVKSGGNAYHGSIYEFVRNTIFDAWRFTDKVTAPNSAGVLVPGGIKPREIQNEFGIVLSGPVIKNKLFLFGNYGQFRNQNGARPVTMTIPTAAMLGYTQTGTALPYADYRGYFNSTGAAIFDPATATSLPSCSPCTRAPLSGTVNGMAANNVIPRSRISNASDFYNKLLLPYQSLTNQNAYSSNLAYGTPFGLANWYMTSKIDYTLTPRNQFGFIVAFGRQASTGPNNLSGLGPPFNVSQTIHPVTTIDVFRYTATINPHLVNQFAIGFGRYVSDSVTPNRTPAFAATSAGILNMPAGQASDGFPGITFSGTFGTPLSVGSNTWGGYAWNNKVNNTFNISDNVQWVIGKHNLTLGGQLVDQQFNYVKVLSPSGPMAFTFSQAQTEAFTNGQPIDTQTGTSLNANTGSSVASYLLGAASAGSTSANVPTLGTRWLDPSFWAEDDYKVSSNLTLNLGLRWDIYPSIHEAHNLFTFLNPNGINSITGNRGTLMFAGNGPSDTYCNCKSPSPVYYKNIAPRVGFAYSVDPKTVVRGSFNVNFARGDWTSGSQSGSPSTLGITPSAAAPAGTSNAPAFYWDATGCTAGSLNGVPCGWNGSVVAPTPPPGGKSLAEYATTYTSTLGTNGSATVTYFDPYRGSRTPEYINFSFGVQRQITRDMSITASYVGSQGHFINIAGANGSRNNKLPESLAALAGYNTNGTTLTPCSGGGCSAPLLAAKATAANIALAAGLGFVAPNPFTTATYYANNTIAQYFVQFPQYSGVSDTTSFVGNTNYHALQLTLRQRAAHGLDFMFNYTYSKSIDDIGTFRVNDNNRLDRSLSTIDQPQNLTATAVYHLPFGHGHIGGNSFLVNAIGGGWNLSGIYVYHSGSPLVATASGCGGAGILNQCMPNLVPGVAMRQNAYGKNITADPLSANFVGKVQYLNPNALTVNNSTNISGGKVVPQVVAVGNGPALYVPGNAPRVGAGNAWSMGYYNFDFGVKRTFPIYREFKLQFEADMLNATNHVVWAAPSGAVANNNFGTITGGLANGTQPRDFQFSGRLNF